MLHTPPWAWQRKMAALPKPLRLKLSSLLYLYVCLGHVRGVLYRGGKLGGYSGNTNFDHFEDLGLDYEVDRVRLHSVQVWATNSGLLGVSASYIANDTVNNTLSTGREMSGLFQIIFNPSANPNPPPDLSISLQQDDLLESMSGHYVQVNDIYVVNAVCFSLLKGSGSREEYCAGKRVGWSTSIIGPVVGFYGTTGLQFDQLGVYIDPEQWNVRPTRMLQGPRYGLSKSMSANLFDDFLELGSPFSMSIHNLTVQVTDNIVKGLSITYQLDSGDEMTVMHGLLAEASNQRTIVFEDGDYLKSTEVGLPASSSVECLAYIEFTVFRVGQLVAESVAIGNLESTSFLMSGPIGAFYGFSDNTCVSGLGTYRLLAGSEVKDTCRLPPLPANANYSTVPESISAGSSITLVCQNGYLLVTDGNLTCQERGTWSGEVQCQRGCEQLHVPPNGTALESPDKPLVGTQYRFACKAECELVGSQTRMCTDNGTWSGNITKCKCDLSCGDPPAISNGLVDPASNITITVYTCEQGYILSGSESITCNGSTGRWSLPPTCQQAAGGCEQLHVPPNGTALESPDKPLVGTQYRFACKAGCELVGSQTRVCTDNGTWSGNITKCKCDLSCGDPPAISNGLVDPASNITITVYTCEQGYILSGSESITCNGSTGRWSLSPTCQQAAVTSTGTTESCLICNSIVDIGVPTSAVGTAFLLLLCCPAAVGAVCCCRTKLSSRKMVVDADEGDCEELHEQTQAYASD